MSLPGVHADPILVWPEAELALAGLAFLQSATLLNGSFEGWHSEDRGRGEREEESAEEAHGGI